MLTLRLDFPALACSNVCSVEFVITFASRRELDLPLFTSGVYCFSRFSYFVSSARTSGIESAYLLPIHNLNVRSLRPHWKPQAALTLSGDQSVPRFLPSVELLGCTAISWHLISLIKSARAVKSIWSLWGLRPGGGLVSRRRTFQHPVLWEFIHQ